MLQELKALCEKCTLCRLGTMEHVQNGEKLEPHVFSNMKPSRYVVCGQNPGFNECKKGEPFVGDAGNNFNKEIAKYGIERDMFYITNIVHCHTPDNRSPFSEEIEACSSIVDIELQLMNPNLVITLGKFAFEALCKGHNYSKSLGTIVKVKPYGYNISVFPILHPSGRNLTIDWRKKQFEKDVKVLCSLIKKLEALK